MSNSTHLLNNARAQERVDELETQLQAHTKGEAMWEFQEHEKQCNCQSCLQCEIAEMDAEMTRLQARVDELNHANNSWILSHEASKATIDRLQAEVERLNARKAELEVNGGTFRVG